MKTLAFVGATAIPCNGNASIEDAVILVRGDWIEAVGRRSMIGIPDDAERIDCSGKWIMPGLIDSHIHFFQSGGLFTRPDGVDLRRVRPYAEECAWIREHLDDTFARYLAAGITSVVDNGGPFWNYSVRARAAGMSRAPRVSVAGPLISSVERPQLDWGNGDFPIVGITTPEEAQALVQRELNETTDFTKVWWIVGPQTPLEAFRPIVQAVVEKSHAAGVRVMAHATELETARAAVTAGADILVHSVDTEVDDAFIELLLRQGTVYCPTLTVMEGYAHTLTLDPCARTQDLRIGHPDVVGTLFSVLDIPNAVPPETVARRRAAISKATTEAMSGNLRRLRSAGVPIAAGTDAGNIGTLHAASMLRELELMVQSGLSPEEVLIDVTHGGAKLMGRQHELGSLDAGKLADFIVLSADPLADIKNTGKVTYVVKGGELFEPADLVHESAENIVQRQLNAYNARNIEVFAECYAPDAEIIANGKIICDGHNAIREKYGPIFEQNPKLHASIGKREIKGSNIVDHERVTGRADGTVGDAIVRYAVKGNAITNVSLTH